MRVYQLVPFEKHALMRLEICDLWLHLQTIWCLAKTLDDVDFEGGGMLKDQLDAWVLAVGGPTNP